MKSVAHKKNMFIPHADLSSEVDLDVDLGVITKTRPERSVGNLLNEARALRVWESILDEYNDVAPPHGHITSPKLVSFSPEDRSLRMTFCNGVHLGRAITRQHELLDACQDAATSRQEIAYRIGSLAGLKLGEGFVHGDYQQRHVFYNPLLATKNTARLAAIDVESSRPTKIPEQIIEENETLHNWFIGTAPKRHVANLSEAYNDGLHDGQLYAPRIIGDAIRKACKEIQ